MEFLKNQSPFPLGEHQRFSVEEILFPDKSKKILGFIGLSVDEVDSVQIDTEHITRETGDTQSWTVKLKIEGLYEFARKNH